MPYKVSVTPEVARLKAGDAGSRNVRVGETLYTFNRVPQTLDELPDEVKNDPHLVVVEDKPARKAKAEAELAPEPTPELVEAGTEGIAEVAPAEPAPRQARAKAAKVPARPRAARKAK